MQAIIECPLKSDIDHFGCILPPQYATAWCDVCRSQVYASSSSRAHRAAGAIMLCAPCVVKFRKIAENKPNYFTDVTEPLSPELQSQFDTLNARWRR